MTTVIESDKKETIVFHYNKKHSQDQRIPPWVIKYKGQTYYVNHLDVSKGVGFSTKETPDSPHTKGSIKFKGKLRIYTDEQGKIIGQIF
jgi:hypothetical protein